MKKINIIWLLALIALAFTSCRKDVNDFIPDKDSGQNFKSSLFGVVIDEEGAPVENATIKFGNAVKTSDKNGVYQFKNVDVNSKHNLVTITKSGYFEGSRVFTTDRSNTISIKNILLAKSFDQSFESTTSSSMKNGSITLDFPADAIVIASNNTPYSGTVQVAMKYLDPNNFAIYDQMPGSLSGINAENQLAAMSTYGMVAVEMQTPSGQKLQVASGKKVKMSNRLASGMIQDAPSTIPLWYYDETLGYWKADGEANLVGDTYVGEVGHFTYWNYDSQLPSIILSGKVVDQLGNPVGGADVWIVAQGEAGGGHGFTNADGTFSGMVAKDKVLNIQVHLYLTGCSNTLIYTGQAGPYSSDATLPDINANLGSINNINVSGSIIDCASAPIQNGYVKITSSASQPTYIPVVNGLINGMVISCSAITSLTYQAVNMDTGEASSTITIPVNSNINLGTVSACGTLADFVKVEIPTLSIDTIMYTDLLAKAGQHNEVHAGIGFDSISTVNVSLFWTENIIGEVTPGVYPIFPGSTFVHVKSNPSQYIYLSGTSGTVTVNQGGSQPGDVITGTYDFTGTILGTVITHHITGSFRNTLE